MAGASFGSLFCLQLPLNGVYPTGENIEFSGQYCILHTKESMHRLCYVFVETMMFWMYYVSKMEHYSARN